MPVDTVQEYLTLAENTGAFHPHELDVLQEVLEETFKPHDGVAHYILCEEREGERLLGFIIFGRTPLTRYGWDIYWLVVDKSVHRRGVGRKLISMMQRHALELNDTAIIRIETSGKKEYEHVRNFYTNVGFVEVGRVPDFYAPGDDLVIFSMTIR